MEYCFKEKSINLPSMFSIHKFENLIENIYRYPTFYGINYVSEGIGVIKGENISKEGEWIKLDELNYIDSETSRKFYKTILQKDDLIMTVRGEVGKVAIIEDDLMGCNINANVIRISLKKSTDNIEIYPKYIWEFLNSYIGKMLIRKQIAGGVQETITVNGIFDIDIVLPEFDIQKKLALEVENARKSKIYKISIADTIIKEMSDFILSTLNIAKPQYEPQLYCGVTLANIIADNTFNVHYYHPERMAAIRSLQENKEIPIYKLEHIVGFYRDVVSSEGNDEYLGLAGVESHTGELSGVQEEAVGQAFLYEKNDILYGRLRPYLNKVLLAEKSGICSTEFHVMRVLDNTLVLPEYIASIMRSDLILSQTKHMMTGNTHPRISNDDVKNLYIPVPSLAVQESIVTELKKRRNEARKLKQEAEQEWQEAKKQFEKELLGG